MSKRKRVKVIEEDFQMAPMIDMVFLLLVFFMTVSTLAKDERIPAELPESNEAKVPEDISHRGVVSILMGDGGTTLWVGSSQVMQEELKITLDRWVASNPELRIQLRAEAGVPFEEIKKVLSLCAEAGAGRIIYSAWQQ